MSQTAMARQMIETTKAAFDTSFRGMALLQEQAERAAESFLSQAPWLPEEGTKAVRDWIELCRQGRTSYKEAVDSGYTNVMEFLAESDR